VTTTSDTQIVPPSTQNYNGITFSRDSNYIYYRLGESNLPSRTLYQVPTLGGASRKVIENIASPVSLSPDGTRLAFVRVGAARGETALVVANADGTGERQLAVRNEPDRFSLGGPAWSPDGKLVASGVVDFSPTRDTVWYVVEVPVEGGGERAITSENWRTGPVGQVVWLADGTGLALIAFDLTTSSNQIWHISYPDGVARRITSDVNNYTRLSMSTDSRVLAAVQTETAVGVWVAPRANADRARQISSGKYDGQLGVAWMMPDGNILYTSREGGFSDIWIMDQDGKNQKQLTVNAGQNIQPWATSDGRYIVFSSTRPVGRGIWRMDTDGSNLKQLTYGPIGGTPRTSPEGRWMVFSSAQSGSNRIWKISIDGGEPVLLTNKISTNPIVSPDGSLVACWYRDDQPNALNKLAIVPFAGGDPVKVLDVAGSVNINAGVRWMPDGRSLTFVDTVNGVSNIWSIPVDGGTPKQLTDFKTDQIFWFDYSSDGRQLALSRGTQTSDVVLIKDSR
jgi:Tol biopolymer transport system component